MKKFTDAHIGLSRKMGGGHATGIRNSKHSLTKTSPMKLKIIRSREGSPVLQNSSSQTKVMGSVSIQKIRLINGGKR